MTTRNRQATALTLACLCAAALVGCTNDSPKAGQPNTAPPSSSSTPATSVPTSNPSSTMTTPTAPPGRPSTADGLGLSAAEDFLKHYIDLLNFTYATGDTHPLLAASDKGCVGCQGTADYLLKTNARNGGLSGDYTDHLIDVKELFRGDSGRLGGSMTVRSGNYIERPTPSASPVPKQAHTETWQFTLAPAKGNWVMYEIQVDQ
ncbi:DUF6318 family protein [Kribbella sp. NPDC056861]|uniref:DUF6318 family protein n=1 Tax=Kribbella sp. NPDC056861 TaxID=3154857 RepID=UPI00341F48B9